VKKREKPSPQTSGERNRIEAEMKTDKRSPTGAQKNK
jgi:hypothetical protein